MTVDAHRVVIAGPGAEQDYVLEIGFPDIPGTHLDGAIASHGQEGMHGRQVGIIGAHVDPAEVGAGGGDARDDTRCLAWDSAKQGQRTPYQSCPLPLKSCARAGERETATVQPFG